MLQPLRFVPRRQSINKFATFIRIFIAQLSVEDFKVVNVSRACFYDDRRYFVCRNESHERVDMSRLSQIWVNLRRFGPLALINLWPILHTFGFGRIQNKENFRSVSPLPVALKATINPN